MVSMQCVCSQRDCFLSLLRGVSECFHAKSRGHRPGAVQRHLQTTASTGVADPLPRSAGDLSHVATVWTAYGPLSCIHRSAASGASSAAVRASLAQCACPPDLVRAPTTLSQEVLFPPSSDVYTLSPEQSSSSYRNFPSKPRSTPPHLEFQLGVLTSLSPFLAASPKPTHPFLDQLVTGQFLPLPLPVTGCTGDIIGLCYVPRSVLLLMFLFFVPGVVMAVAYGLISRELYLGLRFDGDDGEIQSRVRNQGALPGGAAPGG